MMRPLKPAVAAALFASAAGVLVRLSLIMARSWNDAPAVHVLGMPSKALSALLLAVLTTAFIVGVGFGFRSGFFGGCDD